jgi:hypothetical protein
MPVIIGYVRLSPFPAEGRGVILEDQRGPVAAGSEADQLRLAEQEQSRRHRQHWAVVLLQMLNYARSQGNLDEVRGLEECLAELDAARGYHPNPRPEARRVYQPGQRPRTATRWRKPRGKSSEGG